MTRAFSFPSQSHRLIFGFSLLVSTKVRLFDMEREKRRPKPTKEFTSYLNQLIGRPNDGEEDIKPHEICQSKSTQKIRKRRARNVIAKAGLYNRWDDYNRKISKFLAVLRRETHFVDVMTQSKREKVLSKAVTSVDEVGFCLKRIEKAKYGILETFRQLSEENQSDTVWAVLGADGDDDGLIDISTVMCSRCGKDAEDGNDMLFCDHTGCCRAYHQNCLDPPISVSESLNDPNSDWFCWQCETLDDNLESICQWLEKDVENWQELFPELQTTTGDCSSVIVTEVVESSDDDDGDYCEEVKKDEGDDDEEENDDDVNDETKNGFSGNLNGFCDIDQCGNGDGVSNDDDDDDSSESNDDSGVDTDIDQDEVRYLLNDAQVEQLDDVRGVVVAGKCLRSGIRKHRSRSNDDSSNTDNECQHHEEHDQV